MLGSILVGFILDTKKEILEATTINPYLTSSLYNESNSYDFAKYCGVNNCPQTILNFSQSKPTQTSIYFLFASLLILCALAMCTTVFFMDNLKDDEEANQKSELSDSKKMSLKIISKKPEFFRKAVQ